jgi:Flp pilus assembly pilin Flp
MHTLRRKWVEFCLDESGQDLIEYSLLLAFIAVCAVGMLGGIKTNTSKVWSSLNVGLTSAQAAGS